MIYSKHIDEWKKWMLLEMGYSMHTIRNYYADTCLFLRFIAIGDGMLASPRLSGAHVRAWIEHISHKRRSSVQRSLSGLRSFLSYVHKYGDMDAEECLAVLSKIRHRGGNDRITQALEPQTFTALLSYIKGDKHDWIRKRNIAIITLMYGAGLRISEILGLELQDWANIENGLRIRGKGSKERIVPIIHPAKQATDQYLSLRPQAATTSALFINRTLTQLGPRTIQMLVKSASKALQMHFTPHTLRHTFATHLIQNNADPRLVQQLLGHANLATTSKYVQLKEQDLLDVYNRSHPRA